ncbi:MAG: DUF748 domain-containing protein [Zoogloeaceae bacterium]|jgi:uncharacterized protein involved in outer membrane biogenesis|nr:DUF748 domain-containing protein [Zoogloeaceae bacterium]
MPLRLPSRRTLGIIVAVILLLELTAWLAVPSLVQSQLQNLIVEKAGHHLTMERPSFNPFTLALTLRDADLREPDGKPLLAFHSLEINLSATSLFRAALVFDAIRLDGLKATVAAQSGDRLNWSALADALQGEEDTSAQPASLPRVDITLLSISDGQVDLADRRSKPEKSINIDPINIELENLSTLPNDQGRYQVTARTGFAEHIEWQGDVVLNPLTVEGSLDIKGIALSRLARLAQLPEGLAAPEGTASLTTQYKVARANDQINLSLDQLAAKVDHLKLSGKAGGEPVLAIDAIEARDGKFDLNERRFDLGEFQIKGGHLALVRGADGRFNLENLLAASSSGSPETPASAAAPWHYAIKHTTLTGLHAAFHDQTVAPPAEFALQDITIAIDDITNTTPAAWPVRASLRARDGGELSADGKLSVSEPLVDLHVKLTDLSLKPAQPYLGAVTTLTLTEGQASGEGQVLVDATQSGYQGSFTLRNLILTEGNQRSKFLKWRTLSTRKLTASASRLSIADLLLDGLDTRLEIEADKTTNFGRIMRKPDTEAPAPDTSSSAPYEVVITRLRLTDGRLAFADRSLILPFSANINKLKGNVDRLGNLHERGRLTLDGEVDDYGLMRASGSINLFDPASFMDIAVAFRNVDIPRLTPYSATFVGRRIDAGKLSLDLQYKINQRQLAGNNQIIIDSLTLGERVESPQAADLPLELAIALLQDSDGRIDLGIPVSGNLDDPEFSYGHLVWQAVFNVIKKIITSPFRALAALFGGDDGIDAIAFEAGRADLGGPEREKLTKLASALGQRPKLALDIRGTFAESDRLALQDLQLRRTLAALLDRPVDDDADPGPIAITGPKVKAALETLFAKRLGSDELARVKDTNLHAVLYEKLRAQEPVSDEQLQTLAKARGEAALTILQDANAPMQRITLGDSEQIEALGQEVPLKLEAKAAP